MLNSSQSPDIGKISNGCISNFQISGQSFKIENCQNSRIGNDIYMKLGPVTKFDKRNRATSKQDDDDVISTN